MEEPLRALSCLDRQIRPGGVADEQRVAGEDDPGISDFECGRSPRGSSAPAGDRACGCIARTMSPSTISSLSSSGSFGYSASAAGWMLTGNAVLEGEPAVPGKVVGVRVGLDHADDADVVPLGLLEVLLDRERRVDDDGLAGSRIADDVRRTAERIVDELREDHRPRPTAYQAAARSEYLSLLGEWLADAALGVRCVDTA